MNSLRLVRDRDTPDSIAPPGIWALSVLIQTAQCSRYFVYTYARLQARYTQPQEIVGNRKWRGTLRLIKKKYVTKINVPGPWINHQDCKCENIWPESLDGLALYSSHLTSEFELLSSHRLDTQRTGPREDCRCWWEVEDYGMWVQMQKPGPLEPLQGYLNGWRLYFSAHTLCEVVWAVPSQS